MTDAAVSSLLNRLAPLIEKKVRQEVTLLLNAGDSVNELNRKLETIRTVLEDAENRRLKKEDVRVESWLQKLRDITYEMEDALDEWEAENIKQQLEESEDASESDSWVEKVRSFLLSICLCFKQTVHRRRIAQVIEQLIARLDNLDKENEKEFKFIPKMDNASQPVENHVNQNETSYEDLSEIRGRDDDKNGLLSKLLGSGERDDAVKIISIVGPGGMGKFTLARLLFNANEVKDQFQKKIWICVSDPFDAIKIANQILDALEDKSVRSSELQALLESIEKAVSATRFFLVLDDVWIEKDAKWNPLKGCLMRGASGSRILVTTRKTLVAQIMGSTDDAAVDLKRLKDEDCWYILRQKAFPGRTEIECTMLEETCRKIAERCKGSPLVAKTMGGLLHFREDWESVLQSDMWKLEEVRDDIFPLLKLSYDDLQAEIKRCFTYCAIFPKDEILIVDELVRVWMAQGFVLPSYPIESELQLGHKFFKYLALRSFFQDFRKNDYGHITHCKMHDIVHDFAQFLTKNECLIVEQVDGGEEKKCNEKDVRHLTIISLDGDNVVKGSLNLENLRSFSLKNVSDANSLILLTHLKRVRLLEIEMRNERDIEMRNEREIVMDIPTEIGNLIHLGYLCVSWFKLKELPETIYNLYNLQTLDISSCGDLCGLPKGIHKLRNLRYLINWGTSGSFKFPQGFEKLVNLQRLDKFLALRESGNELGLLEDLNYLEGKFRIVIDHGVDVMQAKKANLINKKGIHKLYFRCTEGTSEEVVEALQPCENLQRLVFSDNVYWPTWIGTLTKLRSLLFINVYASDQCMGDFFTRSITIPFLEYLQIRNSKMERLSVDEAWTTAFPELKTLVFTFCVRWEEWEDVSEEQDITVFPKLKELKFYECGKLKSLPHRILGKAPSLETVEFARCERLKGQYERMRKEDWEKISSTSVLKISNWLSYGDD